MKKALLVLPVFVLLVAPSVASATPFAKDSFDATLSTATSTFSGNFAVLGNTKAIGSNGAIQFNNNGIIGSKSTLWFDKDGSGNGRLFAPFFAAGIALELYGGSLDFLAEDGQSGYGGMFMRSLAKYSFSASSGEAVLDASQVTQDRIFTLPDISGTISLLEANQTWSGDNIFSKGASATTTVNFGEVGESSSHACFNTKNTDGGDISFYFVGTSMMVEANACR